MANSATKLSRFTQANNLTSGVVFHKQLNRNQLVAFPTNVLLGAQSVADCAVNNVGSPTSTIRGIYNFANEVAGILTLNNVAFELKAKTIIVTALPEVITYDASI